MPEEITVFKGWFVQRMRLLLGRNAKVTLSQKKGDRSTIRLNIQHDGQESCLILDNSEARELFHKGLELCDEGEDITRNPSSQLPQFKYEVPDPKKWQEDLSACLLDMCNILMLSSSDIVVVKDQSPEWNEGRKEGYKMAILLLKEMATNNFYTPEASA